MTNAEEHRVMRLSLLVRPCSLVIGHFPMRRLELLLFLATFFAFAYFNQGGGWNQNSRFAEVRAMVEEGRFDIDDFLVYRRDTSSDDLVRVPVYNTAYDFAGKRYRL